MIVNGTRELYDPTTAGRKDGFVSGSVPGNNAFNALACFLVQNGNNDRFGFLRGCEGDDPKEGKGWQC